MRKIPGALFGVLIVAACAGKSESHGNGAGDDGGTTGTGGNTPTGGSMPTGGNPPTGGTAGTGPTPSCLLPPESGNCDAYMERYAFDAQTGTCRGFVYGGCGGNGNNFETAEECHAACASNAETDFTLCTTSSECIVSFPGCCGGCEPVDFTHVVAINSRYDQAHYETTCPEPVTCGACPTPTGPPNRPWLGATCRAGHCVVFDARETELTLCMTAAECRLRAGLGCCEACVSTPETILSIRPDVDLESWVCGGAFACDDCAPAHPPGAEADCIDGRCAVDLNLR